MCSQSGRNLLEGTSDFTLQDGSKTLLLPYDEAAFCTKTTNIYPHKKSQRYHCQKALLNILFIFGHVNLICLI